MDSKKDLERDLAGPRTILAFPFGHYDASVLQFISKNGFSLAFSMEEKGNFGFDPLLSIPRITVGKSTKTLEDFKALLAFSGSDENFEKK